MGDYIGVYQGSYSLTFRNNILPYCQEKWMPKIFVVVVLAVLFMVLLFIFQPFQSEVNVLLINAGDKPLTVTDEKYISMALDSSLIAQDFRGFNMTDPVLIKMIKPLGGGYLRIGGTMADRLIFKPDGGEKFKIIPPDQYACDIDSSICDALNRHNFTMFGNEWLNLNELARKTNFTILFDINCLLRNANGTWNSTNAEELIKFSAKHNLNIIYELGNEPNSFEHVFKYQVQPEQLAEDFKRLRKILQMYQRSLLVGPDVTRPKLVQKSATEYLEKFLQSGKNLVDAITWHQYYFSGRDAYLYDYINSDIFDVLAKEIESMKKVAEYSGYENHPMWLGETSASSGGGSPTFSNRFLSTFIWLDKLGLAAKLGIKVVIRQSMFMGHYALINYQYKPIPDWWITVIYRQLVSNKVVDCIAAASSEVRLYCHCVKENIYTKKLSIVVFGMNMKNSEAIIRIQESTLSYLPSYRIYAFILETHLSILSKDIFLNEELLEAVNGEIPNFVPINMTTNTITIPPFALGFWIIEGNGFKACI